jgi:hypothetical protein
MSSGLVSRLNGCTADERARTAVSTPVVIEIVAQPEPVVRDPFIDDLRDAVAGTAPQLGSASPTSWPPLGS